jgi:hypothetical protein
MHPIHLIIAIINRFEKRDDKNQFKWAIVKPHILSREAQKYFFSRIIFLDLLAFSCGRLFCASDSQTIELPCGSPTNACLGAQATEAGYGHLQLPRSAPFLRRARVVGRDDHAGGEELGHKGGPRQPCDG